MSWQKGAPLEQVSSRLRAIVIASTTAALLMIPGAVAAAQPPTRSAPTSNASYATAAQAVVYQARRHLGAPWRSGATGPYAFDCSGLVYRAFADAGKLASIGGSYRSAASLYSLFRSRGLASRSSPQVGDLVVWGYSGYPSHVGIYIGSGMSISTLTSGVAIHPTFAVTKPFIAYLHTRLTGSGTLPPPRPAPRPTPTPHPAPKPKPVPRKVTPAKPAHPRVVHKPKPAPALEAILPLDLTGDAWYSLRLSGWRIGWPAGWKTVPL
jgi:hypothetical protein